MYHEKFHAHNVKFFLPYDKFLYFFFHTGRTHLVDVSFCSCMSKADFLITLGLWPGTPLNPTVAIDMSLMNLQNAALLEGTMSLHNFCTILDFFQESHPT